jgi:hypothetical protein
VPETAPTWPGSTSLAKPKPSHRYFLAVAADHATDRALMSAGRGEHLARLDAEIDNLHAALAWAVGQSRVEAALALTRVRGRRGRARLDVRTVEA